MTTGQNLLQQTETVAVNLYRQPLVQILRKWDNTLFVENSVHLSGIRSQLFTAQADNSNLFIIYPLFNHSLSTDFDCH
ncbi:hypothetical protein CUZ56_02861 [Saezia sanguinis]|uniref:Uncharacterized protein n=1 Tax=Saezia sanguinis TaxID=1965230 RepID=A0A433SA19_9BURK|nr:hypothetical protein CUZ56_02861 [Saezia sanguinis]